MAKLVRFTGARSGLPGISTSMGRITRGTVVEVTDAQAESWVANGDFEPAKRPAPGTPVLSKMGWTPVPPRAPKVEAEAPRKTRPTKTKEA